MPVDPDSFEELRNCDGYIDKTDFILHFHYKLTKVTCLLRPRRSGKTQALQMLKSFYCVPKIDVDAFDPDSDTYPYLENTAEDVFEGTFINDPDRRTKFFENVKEFEEDVDFVKNNMSKWPVIFLDFKNIKLSRSHEITEEKIISAIARKVIKPAFKEYDYLLFHQMA
jgi:hypothetical protein